MELDSVAGFVAKLGREDLREASDPNIGLITVRTYERWGMTLPEEHALVTLLPLALGVSNSVWSVPGMNLNTSMALDAAEHRLFVVGRKPGKLFIRDTRTESVIQTLDSVEGADDLGFDATLIASASPTPAAKALYVFVLLRVGFFTRWKS